MSDVVDLNLWRLEYPGVSVDFGTHESGYPLTKQVSAGVVAAEYGDQPHPVSDGVVPGVDRTRGRVWSFAGAHLRKVDPFPEDITRWNTVLDHAGPLEAAWRAEDVAQLDGAVAALTNVDRDRTLYGRPRNYAPGLDNIRQGWSTWSGEFHALDGRAYGPRQTVAVTTVAGFVGGFTYPTTWPRTTSSIASTRARILSVGRLSTYPVITLEGGCLNPRLQLLNASGGVIWTLSIDGSVPAGKQVVIDARPWSRGTTIGGSPADGRLRGTQLSACRIPVGATEARYSATANPGGTIAATVAWQDAYAGL